MRTQLALVAVVVLGLVLRVSAQTPVIGPNDAIGFDYLNTDLATYQVNSFQAQWDGSATWSNLGMPTTVVLADTAAGSQTYKVIPTFTSGNHSVAFRACNATGCGGASAAFPFISGSVPNVVPANLRKIPR